MSQTTVTTHSDGIPIVKTANVTGPHPTEASQAHPPFDDFYRSKFSTLAENRAHDGIRAVLHLEQRPGIISLLAGKPHAETYPFTSLGFSFRDPTDPSKEIPVQLTAEELELGLQYSPTIGIPSLVEWIYGLQDIAHGRKRDESWKMSVGNGSQDLIYKAVTSLVNPGDAVLVETPAYAGVIPMFQTLQCEVIEVEMDADGILSSSMREILENWPTSKPKPKVLYTVPYGCNPTGATATLERRLEVLELSRVHDFIILEDDPYHFLYYGAAPRPPSYFALENDQSGPRRVLRFDSLSKILSAGIRLGFVSGPSVLVQAIIDHSTVANLQPNSLTQVLAAAVLTRWGYDGFLKHAARVAQFYRAKRDVFQAAMLRHLSGLAQWSVPEAGMFMWFKLDLGDEGDSDSLVRTNALERGVLALPGTVFYPLQRKSAYVRASFSLLGEQDVDEALRRLKEALLEAIPERAWPTT